MNPLRALPLAAFCLAAACGRTPRLETRTFTVRHLPDYQVRQMLGPYVDTERPAAKGALSVSAGGTVTIRETSDNLDRIGRVLAQYDVAEPNVRLIFKLIRADGAAASDPSIRDIVGVLKPLFQFRSYALVTQGMMTGNSGSGSAQTLAGAGGPYRLGAEIEQISGTGDSASVTLRVHLSLPRTGGEFITTVGVPVGKTAVLGNVLGGSPQSALILTVRPDLVAN